MGSRKTRQKHGFMLQDGCPPCSCPFGEVNAGAKAREREPPSEETLPAALAPGRVSQGSGVLTILLPPLPVIVYQQSQAPVVPRGFPKEGIKQDDELQTQKSKVEPETSHTPPPAPPLPVFPRGTPPLKSTACPSIR